MALKIALQESHCSSSHLRRNNYRDSAANEVVDKTGDVCFWGSVFDFDLVGRNTIILEPRFAFAAASMKFPVMPGADNVLAIEPALAQWSACVIARV
jgi:hypothetical protein